MQVPITLLAAQPEHTVCHHPIANAREQDGQRVGGGQYERGYQGRYLRPGSAFCTLHLIRASRPGDILNAGASFLQRLVDAIEQITGGGS